MPEPESIMLRYLRSIDNKMDGLARDIGDVRIRLSSLETRITGVEAAVVHVQERLDGVHGDYASVRRVNSICLRNRRSGHAPAAAGHARGRRQVRAERPGHVRRSDARGDSL